MNTNRGIFENFPNQTANPKESPFAAAETAETPATGSPFTPVSNPFSAVAKQDSPFAVADEKKDAPKAQASGSEKKDSPFQVADQVAEPSEGFGFEAPAKTAEKSPVASPFEAGPASSTPAASPFAAAEPSKTASASTQAAIAAFGDWKEPAASEAPQKPAAAATDASEKPAATEDSFDDSNSDSYSIRQLELRAIFGVDREMTTDEILQRSRALPGIRNIARVSSQDMGSIEGIKNLVPNLGFGNGALKLYIGSVPLEFIREGKVLLAVQTDGGFAPGVRETLMLVARELGRSA